MLFQINNKKVVNTYNENRNIKIVDSQNCTTNYCAIYFSSHNIYYPNTKEEFENKIVDKDSFEWFGTRVNYARKHIFLRDIKKQWYISGINKKINTMEKLIKFLRRITRGYKIVCVGSSAGGYAANLIGNILEAEKVFTFNGQMELNSLVDYRSAKDIDPYVFKYYNDTSISQFYSIKNYLSENTSTYYFNSLRSSWDYEQFEHIKDTKINIIKFLSSRHGIPFIKESLSDVISADHIILNQYVGKVYRGIYFSIQISGLKKTIVGIFNQLKTIISRKIKRSKI